MKRRIVLLALILALSSPLLAQPAEDDPLKLLERDPESWLFRLQHVAWRDVECVVFIKPQVSGDEAVQRLFSREKIKDYVKLRLANDLSFVPLCKGVPYDPSGRRLAYISVMIRTVGDDYPIAYLVELPVFVLEKASTDQSEGTDWDGGGVLGYTSKEKYVESIKEALAGEVEDFASFMVEARELRED